MGESFTDEELVELKERMRERKSSGDSLDHGSAPLPCPRCGSPLDRREVQPRPDVAYVRERIWLICGRCGRSGVIDRPGRKGRH